MPDRNRYLWVGLIVILLITVPYLFAVFSSSEEAVFGGFLFNPIDGYSYLAKMRQGQAGSWSFRLAYTPDPGDGAPVYLFYLVLGHLARLLGLSLPVVFHLARILGAAGMLWALAVFWEKLFQDPRKSWLAFLISALGSGAGWLGVLSGAFPIDFWVAEAYPFLSAYSSPHFGIGLGLMLLLLAPGQFISPGLSGLLAVTLGIIQPFGLIVVLAVRGLGELIQLLGRKPRSLRELVREKSVLSAAVIGVLGTAVLIWQYLLIQQDPVLSVWQAQNLTPTPPFWDLVLGLAPWLLLAPLALLEDHFGRRHKLLLIWLLSALIMAVVPWDLQRRALTGVMVPLSGLGAAAMLWIKEQLNWGQGTIVIIVLCLMLPTNLVILLSGFNAAAQADPQIYLARSDRQAIEWLAQEGHNSDLVLANARIGLYLPAYSGVKVWYGHPFETPDAERRRRMVSQVFEGDLGIQALEGLVSELEVDYLFVSARDPQPVRDQLMQLGRTEYVAGQTLILSREGMNEY